MGKFFFLASITSILFFLIADEITKMVALFIFDEECPKKNLILLAEEKASIWHTTSEVMDDGVIDPRETRSYLKMCLEIIYKEKIKGSKSFGTFRM